MNADLRLAGVSDMDALIDILRMKHADDGIGDFVESKVRGLLGVLLDPLHRAGAVVVIRDQGAIAGTLGLRLTSHWYNMDPHLEALWLFVHPDFRRSFYIRDLIGMAKRYSTGVGIPLYLEVIENQTTKQKARRIREELSDAQRHDILVFNQAVA